jgi:hypothetical protein
VAKDPRRGQGPFRDVVPMMMMMMCKFCILKISYHTDSLSFLNVYIPIFLIPSGPP